jgi:hypothetical protein
LNAFRAPSLSRPEFGFERVRQSRDDLILHVEKIGLSHELARISARIGIKPAAA